jgi:type IV pilus assembly protein PilP
MPFRPTFAIVTMSLLMSCFLLNCGDPKEETKAPVISKKISVQNQPNADLRTDATPTEAAVEKPDSKDEEAIVAKRIYDSKERLNPFIPLFAKAENNEAAAGQTDKKLTKKRIPQTPLERISLNQLNLVAIIRSSSGNRALVEESSGKGYIIKNGTYIGLNSGIVTQINTNNVIVEEEVENLMGELTLQNTEMKLRKPAGE